MYNYQLEKLKSPKIELCLVTCPCDQLLYFSYPSVTIQTLVNPLNAELNPICHLLALLAHPVLHISRIRVKQSRSINVEVCPITLHFLNTASQQSVSVLLLLKAIFRHKLFLLHLKLP